MLQRVVLLDPTNDLCSSFDRKQKEIATEETRRKVIARSRVRRPPRSGNEEKL